MSNKRPTLALWLSQIEKCERVHGSNDVESEAAVNWEDMEAEIALGELDLQRSVFNTTDPSQIIYQYLFNDSDDPSDKSSLL